MRAPRSRSRSRAARSLVAAGMTAPPAGPFRLLRRRLAGSKYLASRRLGLGPTDVVCSIFIDFYSLPTTTQLGNRRPSGSLPLTLLPAGTMGE